MTELSIELVKSKLNVGDVLRYKDICTMLDQPTVSGKQKMYQLKSWHRYFDFEKVERKLLIKDVYDSVKPKEPSASYIEYEQFLPSYEDGKKKGVYIIKKDNTVYIGSTVTSFRNRFIDHYNADGLITYDMLHNGATFDILWCANEDDEEYVVRDKEEQYIKLYNETEGYEVMNTKFKTYTRNIGIYINRKYNGNKIYDSLKFRRSDIDKVKKFCEENNIEYK